MAEISKSPNVSGPLKLDGSKYHYENMPIQIYEY